MKPVAILLALASTAFTVSAGDLPRFAECTASSQCRSGDCDKVCGAASVNFLCVNDWECISNHCKGGRCYDCRDPRNLDFAAAPYLSIGSSCIGLVDQCCESQCRANVDGDMQCIDNGVVSDMGGHGPFPVQKPPPRH